MSFRRPQAAELERRLAEPRRFIQVVAGARQVGSSPKLQVLNTALMSAQSDRTFAEARADREYWGRLVESAVGAHLANAASVASCALFYWREQNREVDFVVRLGRALVAIEVKRGRSRDTHPGLGAFAETFKPARTLVVGTDGIPVADFLLQPVTRLPVPAHRSRAPARQRRLHLRAPHEGTA